MPIEVEVDAPTSSFDRSGEVEVAIAGGNRHCDCEEDGKVKDWAGRYAAPSKDAKRIWTGDDRWTFIIGSSILIRL
jgi:hypothetical protein